MSCKKSSQRHGQAPKPPALWWEQLDDECPITLEPLSSLPYPPFQLGPSLFDGVALASYVVSRGMFENPLTREALTFSDCKKLDDYVKIYHKHDTRMAVCCEAFTLSQNVKVKQSSNDNGDRRARVLRSEAAAALCHLFVYRSRDAAVQPDQAAWSAQEQLNAFNLYSERPSDQQSAASAMMDGLRIIDDDEERIVQAQQSEWNEVQEAFPPLADNGASAPPKPVSVDQHLLQTAKATAEQTRQQEYQQRLLLQQAHIRMIREAKARQEERKRARQAAKAVRQQHYEMERLEEDELERARAEIEQWRKEHWERLLQESTTIEEATKKSRSNVHEVEPPEDQTTNALDEAKRKEQERQEQEAKKKAKAAAKRRRAKERKKEQKELERKEAEKQQQAKLLQEKKAASSKKCDSCGQGYLGYGFEKFGHSFCSTKCARAGVPD